MVLRFVLAISLLLIAGGAGAASKGPTYPKEKAVFAPGLVPDSALMAIRANYAGLARAFDDRDVEKILTYRAADFHAGLPTGETANPAQMKDALTGFFLLNLPPIRTYNTILAVDSSAADLRRVITFQQASRYQLLSGVKRFVEHDATQREWWKLVDGRWKLWAVDNIGDKHRWVDGKAIDPSKPYDPSAPPYEPEKP